MSNHIIDRLVTAGLDRSELQKIYDEQFIGISSKGWSEQQIAYGMVLAAVETADEFAMKARAATPEYVEAERKFYAISTAAPNGDTSEFEEALDVYSNLKWAIDEKFHCSKLRGLQSEVTRELLEWFTTASLAEANRRKSPSGIKTCQQIREVFTEGKLYGDLREKLVDLAMRANADELPKAA